MLSRNSSCSLNLLFCVFLVCFLCFNDQKMGKLKAYLVLVFENTEKGILWKLFLFFKFIVVCFWCFFVCFSCFNDQKMGKLRAYLVLGFFGVFLCVFCVLMIKKWENYGHVLNLCLIHVFLVFFVFLTSKQKLDRVQAPRFLIESSSNLALYQLDSTRLHP